MYVAFIAISDTDFINADNIVVVDFVENVVDDVIIYLYCCVCFSYAFRCYWNTVLEMLGTVITNICDCVCLYEFVRAHACLCICAYVCECVCVCLCVLTCEYIHVREIRLVV